MSKPQPWVSQVRRPGWHPQDRRPHLPDNFTVRGKYKGTYVVHPTPPRDAWVPIAQPEPEPTPEPAPATPEWDTVLKGIAVENGAPPRDELRRAIVLWRRRTLLMSRLKDQVRSQWHGSLRRSFTR